VSWAGSAGLDWDVSDGSAVKLATASTAGPGRANALATVTLTTAVRTMACEPKRRVKRWSLVTKRAIDELLGYPLRQSFGTDRQIPNASNRGRQACRYNGGDKSTIPVTGRDCGANVTRCGTDGAFYGR
jgi:hypothetical protein